jgi:CXXC-20-CXXC protein
MQKCENCGTKFKYKNVQLSLLLGGQLIYCDICDTHYNGKIRYKLTFAILVALPILFIYFIRDSITSIPSVMWLYIIYAILIVMIMPFIIKYKVVETKKI